MFRQLPNYLSTVPLGSVPTEFNFNPVLALNGSPRDLFNKHPLEIVAYMEAYWNKRKPQPLGSTSPHPLGHPDHRSDEPALLANRLPLLGTETLFGYAGGARPIAPQVLQGFLYWDHLIYAYMIENTRVYEIFRRVLHEYRHGEKSGLRS